MIEKLTKYLNKIGINDDHAARSIAHDVVLDDRAAGYEFRKAKLLAYNYIERTVQADEKRFISLDNTSPTDSEETMYEVIGYDDFNEKKAAIQEDQRQLIFNLVSGMDERTTLIVQTWLSCDKPSLNEVGRRLQVHPMTVHRCIQKLSRNYDSEKFGHLTDYLTA